jgi:hypothetical protein
LSFAHGPADSHPSANPGADSPIEHLILADPDEDEQPQASGNMAIPAAVPYGAIQANFNFNHLAARVQEGDQHRLRMEEKLDKITQALDALQEQKGRSCFLSLLWLPASARVQLLLVACGVNEFKLTPGAFLFYLPSFFLPPLLLSPILTFSVVLFTSFLLLSQSASCSFTLF